MLIFSKTIRFSFLVAFLGATAFFIYQSTAGPMKIITTGSSTVKVNMPNTNRLTSGLVGYWTFDGQDTNWTSATAGTTADKSPVGTNTGTLANMSRSTSPAPGVNGQGLYFNNDDAIKDYVDVGNGSSLGLTGSMTISAWIKMNIPAGVEARIVIKGEPSPWGEVLTPYNFGINSASKLKFSTAAYEDVFVNTSTDSINLNQWQHVVVARNSSTQVTFYINSIQDSGGWQAHTPGENGIDNVLIGLGDFTLPLPGTNGRGVIDEVRIYNRALSQSEVTELYQQGQAKINVSQAGKLTNGLVGHWTFDGQDTNWGTNTTNDRSGNNNNGALTNMSTTTSPVPGINGQALSFDGVDDYISVPYSATIDVRDGNIPHTVSMWFKLDTLPTVKGANELLFAQADGAGTGRSWLMMPNFSGTGYVANEILVVGRGSGVGSNVIAVINTWYFVVLQYDGAALTVFVNGAQGDSMTTTLDENATGAFRMGIAKTDTSYLDGTIDEVRIYNRALSAAEITELYNMGR